ncbi:MAG: ABC transporter substrate-binding protein [Candidatus Methylomirabilales bacterium]
MRSFPKGAKWSLWPLVALVVGAGPAPALGAAAVPFMLDWTPNHSQAYLFVAQAKGFFAEQGLEVILDVPKHPADPIDLVAAGKYPLAISYSTDVVLARDQGQPVVCIASVVQHPLDSVMTLKTSGIDALEKLAGKRVGHNGTSSALAYLRTIFKRYGVDPNSVQLVNVGYDLVDSLAKGRVDALIGGYWVYEKLILERQGHAVNAWHLEDIGIPDHPELVIITSEQAIRENPELLRRFLAAATKGAEWTLQNPVGAIDILVGGHATLDRTLQLESLRLETPLLTAGVPRFGFNRPAAWEGLTRWMFEAGLTKRLIPAAEVSSNRFLPAAP